MKVTLWAGALLIVTASPALIQQACLHITIPAAQISNTHDGDTFTAYAFAVPPFEHVRVLGVDTPELKDSLTTKAREARVYTTAWLARGPVTLDACKRDSFGRYLAIVTRGADTLAVDLIAAGLGVKR